MKRTLFVVALATFPAFVQAQEISRVGTSGAQFLKFGGSARAAAMAQSVVAVAGDVGGLQWNPAGAAAIDRRSLEVSYLDLYMGVGYGFFGYVEPLGQLGVVGTHALFLRSEDIEITTLEEPNGTGQFYSVYSLAAGLTYARALTDRFSLGVTGKYVQEGIYNEVARTLAFDAGVVFATGLFGTNLGVSLTNLGGKLQMQGEDLYQEGTRLQFRTEQWPLPTTIRLGLMSELVGPRGQLVSSETDHLIMALSFVDANDAPIRSNFGAEYLWRRSLALRVGYHQGSDTARLALGTGLHSSLGRWRVRLDYAFVGYRDLGSTNQFTLGVDF